MTNRVTPSEESSKFRQLLWLPIHRVLIILRGYRDRLALWRVAIFQFWRTPLGKIIVRWTKKWSFWGHQFAHTHNERLFSGRFFLSASWQVFKIAVDPIVYAFIAVTLSIGLPAVLQRLAPDSDLQILSTITPSAVESYIEILSVIAQVAPTMLALFFATVSIVVSTKYLKVPTEIHWMLVNDDVNRRYLQLLAHVAAVAIVGLGLHAFGVFPSSLLIGYLLILSTISLLAFLPVGARIFSLFDPSTMSFYPTRSFLKSVKLASCISRRWDEPSFQSYANRVAETQLRLLSDLLRLIMTEDNTRYDAVVNITKTFSRLLRKYASQKYKIPSQSLWFSRKAEFKRWEITDSSATSLALQTGVSPTPNFVPDHQFTEVWYSDAILKCLNFLLHNKAYTEVVEVLTEVMNTSSVYARMFGEPDARLFIHSVTVVLVEHLKTVENSAEPLKLLQMVDVHCVAALTTILDASLSLTEPPIEKFLEITIPILKLKQRVIYANPQPREVIGCAEDLFKRMMFEQDAEGVVKTQPWYIKQIIAASYADVIRETVKHILLTLHNEFLLPTSELVAAKQPLCAGVWSQRGIEACNKAHDRVIYLEKRHLELKNLQINERQWHPLETKEACEQIEIVRAKFVLLIAEIIPDLCSIQEDGTLPDLIGQARAWLAEELVGMMERKQNEGFEKLYIGFFNASISIFYHLVAESQFPSKQQSIDAAYDCLLHLMSLSGLAFIYSELDETKFSQIVAVAWDLHLNKAADRVTNLQILFQAINIRPTLPIGMSGATQRFYWGRQLIDALKDRGICFDKYFNHPLISDHQKPHRSAVIESFHVFEGHPMLDPIEYFAALYLVHREEAAGIEIPRPVRHCIDAIKLARRRINEFKDETEP